MIISVVVLICIVLIVSIIVLYIINQDKTCTHQGVEDTNAEYTTDEEGKCKFVRCKDTTYIKDSTGICVLDQSGQDCTPEGTPDANAIYETNVSNVCEFNSCIIGYEVGENDVCIMAEIEDDGSSGGTGGGTGGGSSGGTGGGSSGGTGGGSTGGGEAPDDIIPLNVPTSETRPSRTAATHYGLVKNVTSTSLQQLEVFDLDGFSIELISHYKAGGSYKKPSQVHFSIGDRIYLEKLVDTLYGGHQAYEEVQGTVLPSPSECTVTTPITRYIKAATYTYATWNSLNENWEHFNNHGDSVASTTLKVLDSDGCNVLGHQDGYQLRTHQPNFNQNVALIDFYAVRVL